MRLPPYPSYADSGREQIGPVPSRWQVKPLWSVATLNPSKSEVNALPVGTEVTFLPMEAVSEDGEITGGEVRQIESVYAGYTYFREGDVLIAKITPCFENGKRARAVGLSSGVGFGTTEFHVIRPNRSLDMGFLFYVTSTDRFRKDGEVEMTGAAGQQRVPADYIRSLPIPLPSLDEQRAITAFLDRETVKIDALIAKQERLIELLEEQRQAAIARAVTKGLDPGVPVKASGVDWLGEVPRDWTVQPLMHLTDLRRPIMYGIVLPGPNVDEGVLIVKGGDVKPGRLTPDRLCRTTAEIEARYVRSRLRVGDLLYSIRGSIGEVEIVPQSIAGANITQDAARIAPRRGVDTKWLLFALRSQPVFRQLASKSMGAAVSGINIRDLKRAMVPTPPLAEQQRIGRHLDDYGATLTALTDAAERSVALLREHRASLIAAAVTGKIDVRDHAIRDALDHRLEATA